MSEIEKRIGGVFKPLGGAKKTGYAPKHRGATPDTNMSPFAAASARSRAGLPATLPGGGKRIKKNQDTSAFGVEHVSKGLPSALRATAKAGMQNRTAISPGQLRISNRIQANQLGRQAGQQKKGSLNQGQLIAAGKSQRGFSRGSTTQTKYDWGRKG